MADEKKPATVSILSVLATLPSGKPSAPLRYEELTAYLKDQYATAHEDDRNNRHALRDEFYRDGGTQHMTSFIDSVFTDKTVRDLRKKWVPYARFNNAIKRIVNELSTVYSEPAKRVVADDAPESPPGGEVGQEPAPTPNNDAYQALLNAAHMNERMVEVGRLLNLHRALLVGFRVRQKASGVREPVIDIATPANVRAVMHPNDETEVVGWLVKVNYRSARPGELVPKWTLWTDHESVQLTADFTVLPETYQEHGLGICPWVPVTLGPPAAGFWPGSEGEDLVAAHMAIWFNNILLLKETKSATKQTIVTGDGTAVARGQAMDTEVVGELADGQTATTVDMSMDTTLFTTATDHILLNAAHNHGLSPAIVQHQGTQSAEARDLLRLPLKEIRRQQQVPLRRFEASFAVVMAAVVAVDLPSMEFSPEGWRIEFAESETPLDPLSEMTLYEKRKAAGLDNVKDMLVRKHPGMTPDAAWDVVVRNEQIKAEHVELMKNYMAQSGALGANQPDVIAETTAQDVTTPPRAGASNATADLAKIAREILDGADE